MDYGLLAAHIQADTAGLGTAGPVAAGNDAAIWALYKQASTQRVSRGVVTMPAFLVDFGTQVKQILSTPALAASFAPLLRMMDWAVTVDYSDPVVVGALAGMVQANLLTQTIVDQKTTRPLLFEEVVLGVGVSLSITDVSIALQPARQSVYQAAQVALHNKALDLIAATPGMDMREALERADQLLNGANWGHN